MRDVRHLCPVGDSGWLDADFVAPHAMRAGDGADVSLVLRSSSSSVEGVDVGVHGLAGAHLGLAAGRVVLRPGMRRELTARLQLPTSVTPGRHQLVLELRRQLDPDDAQLVPFEIDVLPAPVPVLHVRRTTLRRRGRVRVENPSDEAIQVALTGSANGAAFRFRPTVLDIAPGEAASARLRVVSRARFGRRPATVGAATANASASASATVVGRSRVGPFVAATAACAALLGGVVWALDDGPQGTNLRTAADASSESDATAAVPGQAPDAGDRSSAVETGGAGNVVAAGDGPVASAPSTALEAEAGDGGADVGRPSAVRPAAPAGDAACTTDDGAPAWALRGRVVADGVSSVTARPAGFTAEFAVAATTDEGGFFTICPLALGDYVVTALSEGYYPLVVPARLAGASADLGELPLRSGAASIIGVVHGPTGPLTGATIVVRAGFREVGRATTDDRGEYLVIGLPAPADVVVEVSAPDMAPVSFPAEIRTDGRIRQPETSLTPG
jgi:hypothetical protein